MQRTFHHDRSALHGITVVVETDSGETWIGRCDDEDAERVVLLDADVHAPADAETSREEWLDKADRFGVWPRHRRVAIPRPRVTGLRRLGAS